MPDWPADPARTAAPCASCGAPLAGDQRYCLACGERRADARVPFAEVLAAPAVATPPRPAARPPRWQRVAMPRPLALTVAGIFICGLALGAAIGPPAPDSLAAGQSPIVVAQAPAPASAGSGGASGAGTGSSPAFGSDAGTAGAPNDLSTLGGADPFAGAAAASSDSFLGGSTYVPVTPVPADPGTGTDTAGTDTTGTDTTGTDGTDGSGTNTLPAVGHVFTITLAGAGSGATFAHRAGGPRATLAASAPYLARTLTKQGKLLSRYYAVAHGSLANLVAMVSGQPPTPETLANCPVATDVKPGRVNSAGLAVGSGCVYPSSVQTIADQLATIAYSWRAYVQDIDQGPPGTPKACRRPPEGQPDPTQAERPGDGFAASRVPFLYFDTILDAPDCAKRIVPIERLADDLKSAKSTPEYVSLTPSLCDGGWAAPCLNGKPGGLGQEDAFLKQWVPKILASPAFKQDGLLVITFDQAPTTGDDADSRGCCGSKPGPNVKNLGGPAAPGAGGGIVGALVISPFVKGGTEDSTDYNHYSLLATVEDLFGLGRLGNARAKGVEAFGANVFDRTS